RQAGGHRRDYRGQQQVQGQDLAGAGADRLHRADLADLGGQQTAEHGGHQDRAEQQRNESEGQQDEADHDHLALVLVPQRRGYLDVVHRVPAGRQRRGDALGGPFDRVPVAAGARPVADHDLQQGRRRGLTQVRQGGGGQVAVGGLFLLGRRDATVVRGPRHGHRDRRAGGRLHDDAVAGVDAEEGQRGAFQKQTVGGRWPASPLYGDGVDPLRIGRAAGEQHQDPPRPVADLDPGRYRGARGGVQDTGLRTHRIEGRLVHPARYVERGRGRTGVQIVAGNLAADDGAGAQERADREHAHGDRDGHHRHAGPRGPDVADQLAKAQGTHRAASTSARRVGESSLIRPSTRVTRRVAYAETSRSWVTMTTVVPS